MTDPALVARYRAGAVTTVVDAVHGADQLANQSEAARQAAFADRIVLSKRDLAGSVDGLIERLRAINAAVPILDAADIAAAALFDRAPSSAGRAVGEAPGHAPDIKAHCLAEDRPLEWPGLVRWLDALTSLRGPDVLRIKGIVRVRGQHRPVAVNGVHHVLHPPELLEDWPGGRPATRLVVITRGVRTLDLHQALEAAGAINEEG